MKQPEQPSLERVLGPWAATAVVIGTVIGSGVFFKPRAIAADVPYAGLAAVVWVLGGLLTLAGALIYAEVACLLPQAGGNYVFLREGYGRLFGWLWGWVDFWMIRTGSIAALATAFAISLHDVYASQALRDSLGLGPPGTVPDWGQRLVTILVILALAAVNARGVEWGGGLQVVITAAKVATVAAVGLVPMLFLATGAEAPGGTKPSTAHLAPFWPETFDLALLGGVGTALLAVLWPYHGWQNIAPIAGEVKEPQRNLPLALLAGVGTVILLYLGCNLGYYLLMRSEDIAAAGDTPSTATLAGTALLGPLGAVALNGVILCSVFGSLNGNLLVGPRLLYAMGKDGLAPSWLQAVHPDWKTPANAIFVLAVWSCLLIVGVAVLSSVAILPQPDGTFAPLLPPGKGPFDQLTDFAMFGAVIFETMAVLAIFTLRARMPDAERPYKAPLYPWLPAAYAVIPLFILISMLMAPKSRNEALIGFAFIGAGVAVYYALGLYRVSPERPGPGLDFSMKPASPEGAIREPSATEFKPPAAP